VSGVSTARNIPMEKMPDLAKGRVFTGAQAVKLGLVDELGGFDTTFAAVRKKLDLKPDDVLALQQFPAPLSPTEKVMKLLKNVGIEGAMAGAALGQWQHLSASLGPLWGAMSSASHVQTRAPVFLK